MSSISIDTIYKNYGQTTVLHGVDLEIEDGEFVVLVGPSGCGKSTLLRMIAGLEEITSGDIRIGENVVNDLPPRDRDIAMVFQSYALYPHMNVADNMSYSLKMRKTPRERIDSALRETARVLGLEALLARRPKALSGGQRQRVAMGRAIVRKPQAFLFDEPLSNLDARLREQMRVEIRKLHREIGATSVYVTHDQIEAMTMADRIVAMHDGVIQQVGAPLELYDDPANVFVAGFIGSPAMNFLPAELSVERDVPELAVGAARLAAPTAKIASRHAGRVIAGVRPEKITLADPSEAGAVPVTVDLVEQTGVGTVLHLDLEGNPLMLFSIDRPKAKAGDKVAVRFAEDSLQLFDPETEMRIRG